MHVNRFAAEADERWTELGERLDKAIVNLSHLAEATRFKEDKDRLEAKIAAVQAAKGMWEDFTAKDGRTLDLLEAVRQRRGASTSLGEAEGYGVAMNYLTDVRPPG